MTERQEPTESSSGERVEDLLKFNLPDVSDVEIYLVRLDDGRVVARTAEELEAPQPSGEGAGDQA